MVNTLSGSVCAYRKETVRKSLRWHLLQEFLEQRY